MKYYLLIFAAFSGFTCFQEQSLHQAIKGNWQIYSNSTIDSISYTEIYIDSSFVHIYTSPIGLIPSTNYYIEADSLYTKEFSSNSFTNSGQISVEKNLLKIRNERGILVYRKLDGEVGLDKLKNGVVNEYEYGPVFYNRMQSWIKELDKNSN